MDIVAIGGDRSEKPDTAVGSPGRRQTSVTAGDLHAASCRSGLVLAPYLMEISASSQAAWDVSVPAASDGSSTYRASCRSAWLRPPSRCARMVFGPECEPGGPRGFPPGPTTGCAFGTDHAGAQLVGKDAAKRCGKMLDTSSCFIELQGRRDAVGVGRHQVGWPRISDGERQPLTCRIVETGRHRGLPAAAGENSKVCPAFLRSAPIAFSMAMHAGQTAAQLVLPWIQRKSSIQAQRMGARRHTSREHVLGRRSGGLSGT